MKDSDVAIIGGGIVGLATAYRLQRRYPDRSVDVFEKESQVGQHQSGRNSGVLHSGIYYKPGSLKATNCRAGRLAMERFCGKHEIPFNRCGKVIVSAPQHLLPKISSDDLVVGRAGVRAQAVAADGSMVHDFLIQQNGPLINVVNAPSPAATSALNIGDMIVDRLATVLDR